MSDEKEVGVFTSGVAIDEIGFVKLKESPAIILAPVLYELMHQAEGCIESEGIYKFTLSVTKLK